MKTLVKQVKFLQKQNLTHQQTVEGKESGEVSNQVRRKRLLKDQKRKRFGPFAVIREVGNEYFEPWTLEYMQET